MVDDGDQSTGSTSRKAVPRSWSPDSPLPEAPVMSAAPCGGSVELQRLRSHVLPLGALSSSGSSSDEDQDGSASVQAAAPLQLAAAPQQHISSPDPRSGTSGTAARGSGNGGFGEVEGAADGAFDAARATPGGEVRRTPNAAGEGPVHEWDVKPPLIRHGGGALAGLLDSPAEDVAAAEGARATTERFRRATGSLHPPAAAVNSADGVREHVQRVQFASGKKRVGGWGLTGTVTASRVLAEGGHSRQPCPASSGPKQLQQEHTRRLSNDSSESCKGKTDDIELMQRQDQNVAENLRDGDCVPKPRPVPLSGVRRSLSAPPSAGATTLPPSVPSLPQLRSSRPGSSSFGTLGRSLSQSSSEAGSSPSRRPAALAEDTTGEPAAPRITAASQRGQPPSTTVSRACGASPVVGDPDTQQTDAGGGLAVAVVSAFSSPSAGSDALKRGTASQQSAVAKAERRAARSRRRQLRESRRAGVDESPEREPVSPGPRRLRSPGAQPHGPEVELVECLSSSCPALPTVGTSSDPAHFDEPSWSKDSCASKGPEPHASTRASLQNPSASSSGPARASNDGGIELPEQTYSQTLERTIERLRREQYNSQQDNASLESSLRCKEQECESLTRLVRELTAARAKAASARHHLQERHHELLEDYGRQVRVVEMTRQMQKDANLAVADAQHAAREAEDKCALVRRVALQLQERSRALAAENASLRSQVTSLERVAMMQYGGGGQSACMAAYNQLRCAETY